MRAVGQTEVDGVLIFQPEVMAGEVNLQFKSIYSDTNGGDFVPALLPSSSLETSFRSSKLISYEDLITMLRNLRTMSISCPNNILSPFWRQYSQSTVRFYLTIFLCYTGTLGMCLVHFTLERGLPE